MAEVILKKEKSEVVHYQKVKLDNGNILLFVRLVGKKNPQGKPTTEVIRIFGFPELICETKPEVEVTFKTVDGVDVQNLMTFYDEGAFKYDENAKKEIPIKTTPELLQRIRHNNVAMEMLPVDSDEMKLNLLLHDRTSIISLEQMHSEGLSSITNEYKESLENMHEVVSKYINEFDQKIATSSYNRNDDSNADDIENENSEIYINNDRRVFVKDVEFVLTSQETESLTSKPVIKRFSEMSESGIKRRFRKINEKFLLNGTDDLHAIKMKKQFKQELLVYQRAIKVRLDFITGYALDENSSASLIKESLSQEIERYSKNFKGNMTIFFRYYTFFEKRLMSIYAFFCESNADGNADSVYFVNCSPVTGSGTELFNDEQAYIDLPKNPKLGNLRPVDSSVDINGKKLPIVLKPIADINILQDLPTMIVLFEDFKGKKDIKSWAEIADRSKSVCFINVDPTYVGPTKPFDPEKDPIELRENFTDDSETFKSIVGVANPPVIRWPTQFEDSPPLIFPAAPLAGKLYSNIKVDKERSMSSSANNPQNDQLYKDYMVSLSCPSIVNSDSVLKDMNIIFIDTSSNSRADSTVNHFNSMCTLYSKQKYPLTLTLCKNFLDKLIIHHMKNASGVSNSDREAKRVARELNLKLAEYSSRDSSSKPFQRAHVDEEVSTCKVDEDGTTYQYHELHVEFTQGNEKFVVKIK